MPDAAPEAAPPDVPLSVPEDDAPVVPEVPELLELSCTPLECEVPLGAVAPEDDVPGEPDDPELAAAPVVPEVPLELCELWLAGAVESVVEDPELPGAMLPVVEPEAEPMPDAEPEAEPDADGGAEVHAARVKVAQVRINFFIGTPFSIEHIGRQRAKPCQCRNVQHAQVPDLLAELHFLAISRVQHECQARWLKA